MTRSFALACPFVLTGILPVHADDICTGGPRTEWMTEDQVAEILTGADYTGEYVLAVEDGCIEAKMVRDGERIEIYMEPITGEIVLVKAD